MNRSDCFLVLVSSDTQQPFKPWTLTGVWRIEAATEGGILSCDVGSAWRVWHKGNARLCGLNRALIVGRCWIRTGHEMRLWIDTVMKLILLFSLATSFMGVVVVEDKWVEHYSNKRDFMWVPGGAKEEKEHQKVSRCFKWWIKGEPEEEEYLGQV